MRPLVAIVDGFSASPDEANQKIGRDSQVIIVELLLPEETAIVVDQWGQVNQLHWRRLLVQRPAGPSDWLRESPE